MESAEGLKAIDQVDCQDPWLSQGLWMFLLTNFKIIQKSLKYQ